jgi:hypothetical protein
MAYVIKAFMEDHNEDRIPYCWKKIKVKGSQLQDSLTNFRD